MNVYKNVLMVFYMFDVYSCSHVYMFCIFNIFTFDKKIKKKVLESKRSKSRKSKPRRSRTNEIKDQGDQGSMFWSNPWLRLPIEKVGRIV